jgi:hypothetical protein
LVANQPQKALLCCGEQSARCGVRFRSDYLHRDNKVWFPERIAGLELFVV